MCGVTTTFGPVEQRVPGGQRLGIRHVEPRAGEVAAVDRRQQGVVVDEHAAGAVDEVGARLHARECVSASNIRYVDGSAGAWTDTTSDGREQLVEGPPSRRRAPAAR